VIAMAATSAGNLTLVGSIADRARAEGIEISLWAYCRAGILPPGPLITLAIGGVAARLKRWAIGCGEMLARGLRRAHA